MNIINPYRFGAGAFNGFGNASRDFIAANSDYISIADDDALSFGNGSEDSQFSIAAWCYMDDATNFRIFSKYGTLTAVREYTFSFGGDDLLYALFINTGNANRIGRTASGLNTHEGSWVHLAMTYDGTSASTGINIYLTEVGGTTSAVDDADYNNGTYTAMDNSSEPVEIGRLAANSTYADGKMCDVRLYSKELSSAEVQQIADGTHVSDSLVGWWLDDDDDVLDNAGTNDGTNNGSDYSTDGPNG